MVDQFVERNCECVTADCKWPNSQSKVEPITLAIATDALK